MTKQTQRGENDNRHIDDVIHTLIADLAEVKTKVRYGFPLVAIYMTILKFTPTDDVAHVPVKVGAVIGHALGTAGSIAAAAVAGAASLLIGVKRYL